MKILIIGGTRGIGYQLLKQALDQDHDVVMLARHPEKLNLTHDRLTVVPGDILDPESVNRAMTGCDAVCITIGIPPTREPVTVFSNGTRIVITAMKELGVRKLAAVTGIGAGDSINHGGFMYNRIIHPLLLKTIYQDKNRMEALIQDSDLDWVIVRPGFLVHGPATGNAIALTELRNVRAGKITRADVAEFILNQLNHMTYRHQTPLLT